MSDTPKTSIDWARRFTLPVAVPLDESDMAAQLGSYFQNAAINASVTTYAGEEFIPVSLKYRHISNKTFLLPRSCNLQGTETIDLEIDAVDDVLSTKLPEAAEWYDADTGVMAEEYYQRRIVAIENKKSKILPMPLFPENSISLTWPATTSADTSFLGTGFQGETEAIPKNSISYLLTTDDTNIGEMDPLMLRAMMPGLLRFERYHHYQINGSSLQGRQSGNSGRLVLLDLDPGHKIGNSKEVQVSNSFTGLAYEGVDAAYSFSSAPNTMFTAVPELARTLKLLYVHYFKNYNTISASETSGISSFLLEILTNSLQRLLRTWAAYNKFVAAAPAADLSVLSNIAALESQDTLDQSLIQSILANIQLDHPGLWDDLLRFLEEIYVPVFLGISWLELGAATDKLPFYSNDASGWWTQEANNWAQDIINLSTLSYSNWIPVYAGCPLGHPAKYYKQDTAANDIQILRDLAGLTAFEIEAITLSEASDSLGLPAVTPPQELTEYPDLSLFESLNTGYHLVLRPFRIDAESGELETHPVYYERYLGELMAEENGVPAVITMTGEYQAHPLASEDLVTIPKDYSLRSIREDGDFGTIESGQVVEFKASMDYYDPVINTPEELHINISLIDDLDQTYQFIQCIDERKGADYTDILYFSHRYVTVVVLEMETGATPTDTIEYFLSLHPIDYEKYLLVVPDPVNYRMTFCCWIMVGNRGDQAEGEMRCHLDVNLDSDLLGGGESSEKINIQNITGTVYPAVFQNKVGAFRLPAHSLLGSSNIDLDKKSYLESFIYNLGARQDDAYALYNTYLTNAGTQQQRDDLAAQMAVEITAAGDDNLSGLEDLFLKIKDEEPFASSGIKPEYARCMFHQRIRTVHAAQKNVNDFLDENGLFDLNVPVEAVWSLFRQESALDVVPWAIMLKKGIPAIQEPKVSLKIVVFPGIGDTHPGTGHGEYEKTFNDYIVTEIPQTQTFNSSSGFSDLALSKHKYVRYYMINVLSMDIYAGHMKWQFNSDYNAWFIDSVDEYQAMVYRYGYVKTFLHTRMQLGVFFDSTTSDQKQRNIFLLKEAFHSWYSLLGQLDANFGHNPNHLDYYGASPTTPATRPDPPVASPRNMPFITSRHNLALTAMWVTEAMFHYASLQMGPLISGFRLTKKLPPVLTYLRFNFGEVQFQDRLFFIIKSIITFATDSFVNNELSPSDPYYDLFIDFHSELQNDFNAGPDVTRFDMTEAEYDDFLNSHTSYSDVLSPARVSDNEADTAEFALIEDKIMNREINDESSRDDILNQVFALIPGANEKAALAPVIQDHQNMHKMLSWIDSRPGNYWEQLGAYFASSKGKTDMLSIKSAYDNSRLFNHYISIYNKIFNS